MKTVLTTVVCFSVFTYLAAQAPSDPITYTEVVQVDSGTTKSELYNRVMAWINKVYKSPKSVIHTNDKESGEVTLKALFDFPQGGFGPGGSFNGVIKYSMSVYLKDGRYKYEITNFIHESTTYPPYSLELLVNGNPHSNRLKYFTTYYEKAKEKAKEYARQLSESLKSAMSNPSPQTDDW